MNNSKKILLWFCDKFRLYFLPIHRGEEAFHRMQYFYGWAQRPMITRVTSQLDQNIPITVIGGSRSWMRFAESYQGARTPEVIREGRPDSYVGVHYIEGAGHHVHADQPLQFNRIVNKVFQKVDSGKDTVSSQS